MDKLPFVQKIVAPSGYLGEQTPHVRPLDARTEYDLGMCVFTEQIYFRLAGSGDMDLGGFVIEGVDDKSEATRAMDYDHGSE